MVVPLLGEAWTLYKGNPKLMTYFPFRERSITQTYRNARDEPGISDLRYHDLRHEGASRLFEAGFSIEDIAQVTGHQSLSSLWKVYRVTLWKVYRVMCPNILHEKFDRL
jgi:integrase